MSPKEDLPDDVLKSVPREWHNDLREFLSTGEASPAFMSYLDRSGECQAVIDRALQAQFVEVESLMPAVAKTQTIGLAARDRRRTPWTAVVGTVVGCALIALFILQYWQYRLPEDQAKKLESLEAQLRWANRAERPALEIVGKLEHDLPQLAGFLRDTDPKIQERARATVAQLPEILERSALELSKDDKDGAARLRQELVAVISRLPSQTLPDRGDTEYLIGLATNLEKSVGSIYQDAVKNVSNPDKAARLRAYETLGKMGIAAEQSIPNLAGRFNDKSLDPEERKALANALMRVNSEAATRILDRASSKGVANSIVEVISVSTWLGELKSPVVGTRIRAAQELGKFGDRAKTASPGLLKAYEEEKDPWARWELATALNRIDPAAAEKAGVPLFDEKPHWAGAAEREQQQRKVAGLALTGLESDNPEVRARSADAFDYLGSVCGPAFPSVYNAYKAEKDPEVQKKLHNALKKLDPKEAEKKGMD